jgi:HTH-type transcriptional regulator, competence development regulator
MENRFGVKIKTLREQQHLYLRQVAAHLEIDTALISKIEKGVRNLKKEHIAKLAEVLNADQEELLTLYLADQLDEIIKDEPLGKKAMNIIINPKN